MKEFWKSLKSGMMLSGLVSLCLGVVLLLFPTLLAGALSLVLGTVLCLVGIVEIVAVFVRPNGLLSVGRMIPGILSLGVGLVFLLKRETFMELIWILLGIAVLIDAVYKLQYAFELKAVGAGNWWINLVLSLLSLVFAVLLILDPVAIADQMTRLAGGLIVANGVFDLSCVVVMSYYAARIRSVGTVVIRDGEENEIAEEDEESSSIVKK